MELTIHKIDFTLNARTKNTEQEKYSTFGRQIFSTFLPGKRNATKIRPVRVP